MPDLPADFRSSPGFLAEPPAKAALGSLARRRDGDLLGALRRAAESSSSGSGTSLGCLVDPTASLPSATPELRAWAVWGLIVDEIDKLGSVVEPREQYVLLAAFRLPPVPDGSASWAETLQDRFRQLAKVRGLFGSREPLSNTPMNKAWAGALEMLSVAVARKLGSLEGAGWLPYVGIGRSVTAGTVPGSGSPEGFRAPSEGAQPVFVERMTVTAVMHRRTVLRRLTERDVVAREDGVDGYDVHALTGWSGNLTDIPSRRCGIAASPCHRAGIRASLRRPGCVSPGSCGPARRTASSPKPSTGTSTKNGGGSTSRSTTTGWRRPG